MKKVRRKRKRTNTTLSPETRRLLTKLAKTHKSRSRAIDKAVKYYCSRKKFR